MKFYQTRGFAIRAFMVYMAALSTIADILEDRASDQENVTKNTMATTSPADTQWKHNHTPNEKSVIIDPCLCLNDIVKQNNPTEDLDGMADLYKRWKEPYLVEHFTTKTGQLPEETKTGFLFSEFKVTTGSTFYMTNLETNETCWITKDSYQGFRKAYVGPEL